MCIVFQGVYVMMGVLKMFIVRFRQCLLQYTQMSLQLRLMYLFIYMHVSI